MRDPKFVLAEVMEELLADENEILLPIMENKLEGQGHEN